MNIGDAVTALRDGHSVARAGWNGNGMRIYLENGFSSEIEAGAFKGIMRQYDPVVCLYTAQGTHQRGWVCSQADLLADDWQIVEG